MFNNRWGCGGIGDIVGMQLAQTQLFKPRLTALHQRQGKKQPEMDKAACGYNHPEGTQQNRLIHRMSAMAIYPSANQLIVLLWHR